MRIILTLLSLFFFSYNLMAAIPVNDDIKNAILISNVINFCSADAAFTNVEATPSGFKKGIFWSTEGKDVWFKFTALKTDVSVNAYGKTNTTSPNSLISPTIAIYTYEANTLTEKIGAMVNENNLTTAYKGGLTIGQVYYIRLSAEQDQVGTFKLCLNNYNPTLTPGQDCETASILCNKESFTEFKVSGAGNNSHEAVGSCLGTEANTAWYKWTAANNGTLTFTITPTATNDDIDWALYDLGVNGDCSKLMPENLLRCAAGSGVDCTPSYYKTGINLTSTDLTETQGCSTTQDGFVKYVDMIEGHVYALIVDNFSDFKNGFNIEFDGTGDFKGPKSEILFTTNDACTDAQSFTFKNNTSDYVKLKWNFGEGADIANANTNGPHTIKYNTTGSKTVVLEVEGTKNCVVINSYTFYVANKPAKPIILSNKPDFCILDTLKLETDSIPDATYAWLGPNGFSATERKPTVLINNFSQAGDYSLTVKLGDCYSETTVLNIPPIVKNPLASFIADPSIPAKYSLPVPIQFNNTSKDASRFLWDFGDGQSSEEINPGHTYNKIGKYTVSLTAFTKNGCQHSFTLSNLVILEAGSLLVPNSFSPNGDGYNDELNVNITNLKKFDISIFNRYGEKIFVSNDIFKSWDGNYKDHPAPVGAYFYYIKALDIFNKEVKYSGSITLIR